ncbi:hypothetical protein GCM10012275_06380 [Longimycelium tulufanense]|uniref:Prokaryotic phospholipase A2 n=1 Tax=Longimycelium tulufanense TaxID=907463 RepID=A0A8J3FTC3_9PSEU|nr:phospholipase [Longimycelium tulufanense]GGM38064.1 hypothetical protein GCM10012275_06380 [Longimycelium tulufanense]
MAASPAFATTRTARRGALTAGAVMTACAGLFLGSDTAHADLLSPAQLRLVTDDYLFQRTLPQFGELRGQRPHAKQIDWSSDGCSKAPDTPFGFQFQSSCHRHDFGYRNYKVQIRFDETSRKKIDDRFRADMHSTCGESRTCRRVADVYYFAVRQFGGSGQSTAEILDRAKVRQQAQDTQRGETFGIALERLRDKLRMIRTSLKIFVNHLQLPR